MGIKSHLGTLARRIAGKDNPNYFLSDVQGVIHIGANVGQERFEYAARGLQVCWVEPIDFVYEQLCKNLVNIPHQLALRALLLDRDGELVTLHVASNEGASSSVLPFKDHQKMWSGVTYNDSVQIESRTLPTLLAENNIKLSDYDAIVIDTQGSELLILKGALPVLRGIKYVKVEVPDFEAYQGCPVLSEFTAFMKEQGFEVALKTVFAAKPGVGAYYDIVYAKA